jgi:hypothetical protein
MPYYKFLDAKDVDRVLRDGTLRIASLSHYRNLEKNQWIADRLEGSVQVNVKELLVAGNEAASLTPDGFDPPGKVQAGAKIIFENCIFSYQTPEFFIFSLSGGDLDLLTEAMCKNSEHPYDSCINISDLELLAHRMFFRGKIIELDNEPVRRAFVGFRCGQVLYDNVDREQTAGRPPAPSPFLKHTAFSYQREVRIVFQPAEPITSQVLTIKIPRPEVVMREKFRGLDRYVPLAATGSRAGDLRPTSK